MSEYDLASLSDLVACPGCQGQLFVTSESLVCTERMCRLSFPVREGIPVLLIDEAELLEEGVEPARLAPPRALDQAHGQCGGLVMRTGG